MLRALVPAHVLQETRKSNGDGSVQDRGSIHLPEHQRSPCNLRTYDNTEVLNDLIEQSLLFEPPVKRLYRQAVEDVEVEVMSLRPPWWRQIRSHGPHTLRIAKGEGVQFILADVNRDLLNQYRTASPSPSTTNATFGSGLHMCVGKALAQMEAGIALRALFSRFDEMEINRVNEGKKVSSYPYPDIPEVQLEYLQLDSLHGLASLPVTAKVRRH